MPQRQRRDLFALKPTNKIKKNQNYIKIILKIPKLPFIKFIYSQKINNISYFTVIFDIIFS